jgi:hypothetical protein
MNLTKFNNQNYLAMRTYFKTAFLCLLSILLWGFTASDRSAPTVQKSTVVQNAPLVVLVSHKAWGTSQMSSSTDAKGLKTIKITFREDYNKIFYVKNTPTSKTIYETDGQKRAIILDKTAGTVSVTENGAPATFNDKTYQDISVAAAFDISGNVNYFTHTVRCSSTILAIAAKKDQSVGAVENFSSSYMKANGDCSQVGDIKTSCAWGAEGCVSFTAVLCEKTDCN